MKYDFSRHIVLAIAKVVDDFLIAGSPSYIEQFRQNLQQRFEIGSFVTGRKLVFNRLLITQDEDYTVHIHMREYMETIKPIDITQDRRRQVQDGCSTDELREYQGLTGSLNFLGHGVLPHAAFAASLLQQLIPRLKVEHLLTANKMLANIKDLDPTLTYRTITANSDPCYLAFSDASHGSSSYGQTGYVSGIFLPAGGGGSYHVLDWLSAKQPRVSFSSIGSEIPGGCNICRPWSDVCRKPSSLT